MHTNKACRKDGCGVLRLHGRKNTSIFREDCSELFSMNEYLIHILSRDLVDCAGDKSVLGELTLSSVLDKLSHNQNALFTGCIDACYKYYTYKLNCCVDDYVFQISSSTEKYSGESKGNGCIMIIGDIKTKQMVVWTSHSILARLEEVNLLEIKEMEVIDLNNTGCYWEGGVLNGQCFGYGKEYNEENMLVYEGFKYGGRRVCYGKEYRGIRENKNKSSGLIYEGGYCNGDRYGFGALYDLKGDIEFEGKWVDNNPIANDILLLKHDNELLVSMLIEELTIGDNLYNDREITILHFTPLFIHLKRIEIGNECFENVHDFMLDGLKELKSVYIGYGCFSVLSDECMDYPFSIINCPHLEKLYIDNDSFQNFDRFEISNANSLQLLIIHHYCFEKVHEFMLTGLTSLNDVSIGWGFAGCSRDECEDCIFSITDCPNLIRLEIQDGCFKYFNQFILSNVKSLTFLLLGEDCFGKVREFVLDGLESLESVTIDKNCFGISEEECEDAICSIINCPNLTTLNFKEKSFQYFNHFELLNVNDLNTIIFGGYNFRYAYCILKGRMWKAIIHRNL